MTRSIRQNGSVRSHFVFLSAFSLVAGFAQATDYHFTTIDAPGADATFVLDINDSGQLAGYGLNYVPGTPGIYTAFTGLADGSGFTALSRAGTIGLGASGINSKGEISGVSVDFSVTAKGFVRSPSGSYTDVDPSTGGIKSAYSEAVDLNDNGMVVGFYTETQPTTEEESSQNSHGFVRKNGVFSTFDYPGVGNHGTQLYSVNNSGTVSGRYLDADNVSHGFIYSDSLGYVDTAIPGFASTESDGLNNNGDFTAVAYVADPNNPYGRDAFSFIHTSAGYTPFAVPGAISTIAYGLNDGGQVVGIYFAPDLSIHGFTASPVPEPASLAALGIGVVTVLRKRRRR